MIVDTSALVALLRGEDDAPRFARALAKRGERKSISAATFLETAIVIDGSRDAIASRRLDEVVAKSNLAIESVTADQACTWASVVVQEATRRLPAARRR